MAFFIVDTKLNIMEISGKAVQDIFYHTDPKQPIIRNKSKKEFDNNLHQMIKEAKEKEENGR